MPLVPVLLPLLLFAQSPDPISGGAGWVGAGLLGAVLAWLLFVHLPAKDKQLKELMDSKDAEIRRLVQSKDEQVSACIETHAKSVERVVKFYQDESKNDREAVQRRYDAVMALLMKNHESVREGIHAVRNMHQAIAVRQRLADTVQSLEVPIWTKSLDGTLMSWNRACEHLLGWQQGEVVGKSIYVSIIPPERRQEEQEILRKIAAGETLEEYESTRMHKSGRRVAVLVVTSPIRDQTGKVVGASSLAREKD